MGVFRVFSERFGHLEPTARVTDIPVATAVAGVDTGANCHFNADADH